MTVRRAGVGDIPRIGALLLQVHKVHSDGRPDIFKAGGRKYNDEALLSILADDMTPVWVAVDERDLPLGYAFCVWRIVEDSPSLCARRELYIDDICVDERERGRGIGSFLYQSVLAYAESERADAVTLNVWCLNEGAMRFYEKCGMTPLKVVMEQRLK